MKRNNGVFLLIDCKTCEHLHHLWRTDFYPPHPQYFCCCEEQREIGFVVVKPDWCPLELEKAPPMHYIILEWNSEHKKWNIVHYTHSFDDMEVMMQKYPESEYVHMIDLKYIKSHDIMKKVAELRVKNAQKIEELKKQKYEELYGKSQ